MTKDPLIGQQLDEYRMEELLGQGGMARVYRGLDVGLERWVAIKVIDTPYQADETYMMRFEREAKAIAQLEHPNIVSIYRYGKAEGLLYIAMQYIEGMSLDALLRSYHLEGDSMPYDEIHQITKHICSALDYAHQQGVIHRDIKPANIIINKFGDAVLADFGLVLLTDVGTQGEIFGTPHYIAPEQAISSAGAVPQSDLYAVGVMLYEMFTGMVPFEAEDSLDIAMMHMSDPPPPPTEIRPNLSPDIEAVLLKILAKEPGDRYETGADLVQALEEARAASQKRASQPRKTMMERVEVGLSENPLPLIPAAVSTKPPSSKAAESDTSSSLPPVGSDIVEKLSTLFEENKTSFIYAGGGILLIILIFMFISFLGSDDEIAQEESSASTLAPTTFKIVVENNNSASADFQPKSTGEVLPTPTMTPPLPPPTPQILTHNFEQFGQQGDTWQYFWSRPGSGEWGPMEFRNYNGENCWVATGIGEDYVRICEGHAHPGVGADIAWQWTSSVRGPLEVRLAARKLDTGDDGVSILVYKNTREMNTSPLFQRVLAGNDREGFSWQSIPIENIEAGEFLFFVIQKNDNARNDKTELVIQICHHSCPLEGDNGGESEDDDDE